MIAATETKDDRNRADRTIAAMQSLLASRPWNYGVQKEKGIQPIRRVEEVVPTHYTER